jgi:YggT family protein
MLALLLAMCWLGFPASDVQVAQLVDFIGGAEGNRTPDLCSAIAALSHLSYSPVPEAVFRARAPSCQSPPTKNAVETQNHFAETCLPGRQRLNIAGRKNPRRNSGVEMSTAAAFIVPVFRVLNMAIDLYWWIIIVMAVMSWLLAFDVINMRNDFVRSVWNGVNALTEPLLRPIRRFLPAIGGMDISPIVLLLLLSFIQMEMNALVVTLLS